MRHFTLEYWEDDDWYVGRLRDVPGVFSQGSNLEELEKNILEVYQLMREEQKKALPEKEIYTKEIGVEL